MCQKAVDQRSTPALPSVCPKTLTSHLLGNHMHSDASQASEHQAFLPALPGLSLPNATQQHHVPQKDSYNPYHFNKRKAEYDFTWGTNGSKPNWCISKVTCISSLLTYIHRTLRRCRREGPFVKCLNI